MVEYLISKPLSWHAVVPHLSGASLPKNVFHLLQKREKHYTEAAISFRTGSLHGKLHPFTGYIFSAGYRLERIVPKLN